MASNRRLNFTAEEAMTQIMAEDDDGGDVSSDSSCACDGVIQDIDEIHKKATQDEPPPTASGCRGRGRGQAVGQGYCAAIISSLTDKNNRLF